MSSSDVENRARDLFQVLSESNVMDDLTARKRLSKALAEEDIPVAELRRRCQRLGRVDEWVRILVRRKQDVGQTNAMTEHEQFAANQSDVNYVIERIRTDGKSPEFVAESMGWALSRVEDLLEAVPE